jgi:GT2 family glycosyltransferase
MIHQFNAYLLIEDDDIKINEIIKIYIIAKKIKLNFSIINKDMKIIHRIILKILMSDRNAQKINKDYNIYMFLRNSARLTNDSLYKIICEIKHKNQNLLIYGDSVVKRHKKNQYWYEARPEWSPIFFETHDFLGDLIILVCKDELLFSKSSVHSIISKNVSDRNVTKIRISSAITKRKTNLDNQFGVPRLRSPNVVSNNLIKLRQAVKFDEKITIIIPTKFSTNVDGNTFLKNCLESIDHNANKFNFNVVLLFDKIYLDDYKNIVNNKKFNFTIDAIPYSSSKFNFSTAINTGVQHVSNEFILILNDDVYFKSKFNFDCPLKHLIKDAGGTVGVRLLSPELRIQHAGIYFENKAPQHWLYGSNKDYLPESHNYCREVSGSTGAFLFFRKSLYEKIGGMDEQFALDYNDVDLCLNMDRHGHQNILCSNITAIHFESATRKKRDTTEIKKDLTKLWNKYVINSRDSYIYTPADRE